MTWRKLLSLTDLQRLCCRLTDPQRLCCRFNGSATAMVSFNGSATAMVRTIVFVPVFHSSVVPVVVLCLVRRVWY